MNLEFGIDEWFCAVLARTIRDGEVVFHGFGSPCAQVAMHVAKRTHAPGMALIEGSTYALDPDPAFIPFTSNDWSLMRGATAVLRFEDFFDLAARGGVDRMFLSGGQIDRWGNTNVTAIGPVERPKVKLGGGGGGCNLSFTVRRTTLWTTRHRDGRTLVEECDFITDLGHRARGVPREALGAPGAGPEWLVTELGVFDFDEGGHARLRQLFPDVTVEEVRAATAFPLRVASDLRPVPPPDPRELAVIRRLDRLGARRREFHPEELSRRFRIDARGHVCAC